MLCGLLLLSGCSFGSPTDEKLTEVLGEMNDAEKIYRDGQHDLNELEQTEQEQFTEIMELTQEEQNELQEKVARIQALVEERLVHIDEEEASIKKAVEAVDALDSVIEKADDKVKTELEKVKEKANERYKIHGTFVKSYKQLADSQTALYDMLLEEALDLSILEKQVDQVNEENDEVKAIIEKFNEVTESLNDLKKQAFKTIKKSQEQKMLG